MDAVSHASELIAYNRWANQKVVDAMAALSADDLERPFSASRGTLLGTMAHVVTAQGVWLARWTEQPTAPCDASTVEGVASSMDAAQNALESFVATLSDADWDRVIDYRDSAGAPHSVTLGRLMTHVANHGTMHRAEAGLQLEMLGHSPGDLDYVLWLLQQEAP